MGFPVLDDFDKTRLTDPEQIERAVSFLKAQGYDEAGALSELLKMFYIDLDGFAEAVRAA